jgi:hypothetical protein
MINFLEGFTTIDYLYDSAHLIIHPTAFVGPGLVMIPAVMNAIQRVKMQIQVQSLFVRMCIHMESRETRIIQSSMIAHPSRVLAMPTVPHLHKQVLHGIGKRVKDTSPHRGLFLYNLLSQNALFLRRKSRIFYPQRGWQMIQFQERKNRLTSALFHWRA